MTTTTSDAPSGTTDDGGRRRPERPEPSPQEQRDALVRLVVVLAAGAAVTVLTGATKTVAVVVALIAMIMLHELGHFVTAKLGGMKVTEFFVGFGPRLWSIRKGETEYGVKALPLGGYVRIVGMHNLDPVADPRDEPRTYRQQPFPQRLAVAVAGSTVHFLLAFLLFFSVNAFVGIPSPSLEIGGIVGLQEGPSPAEQAGFQVGDRIVSVDGELARSWTQVQRLIRTKPGEELDVVVERDGGLVTLRPTPVDLSTVRIAGATGPLPERRGFLGVEPGVEFDKTDPLTALGRSGRQLVGGDFPNETQFAPGLVDNGRALAGVLSPDGIRSYVRTVTNGGEMQAGEDGGARFLSPVGFVRIAGEAASTGLFEVLILLIAINLFVGLFNLLPLLPLDGGHVAIAVYELVRSKIRGRRYYVDAGKLMPITYAVVLALVFLGVSALYLDIFHPLTLR